MTPTAYTDQVLPQILASLKDHCICANVGLRKLLSFNFQDYTLSPISCADTEILIQSLLRSGNETYARSQDRKGNYSFTCRVCGCKLSETYDEFSINMYRSYIAYVDRSSVHGFYLIGFQAFEVGDVPKVHDFFQAPSVEFYLQNIGVT